MKTAVAPPGGMNGGLVWVGERAALPQAAGGLPYPRGQRPCLRWLTSSRPECGRSHPLIPVRFWPHFYLPWLNTNYFSAARACQPISAACRALRSELPIPGSGWRKQGVAGGVRQLAATLILVGEGSPAKPGQVALPREGGALPYRGFHCSKKALLLSKPVWRASANWLGA